VNRLSSSLASWLGANQATSLAGVPDQQQLSGLVDRENRDGREQEQVVPDGRSQPCDVRRDTHPYFVPAVAARMQAAGSPRW